MPRRTGRLMRIVFGSLLCVLALVTTASARFMLPPVVDEYRVLADTWQIQMAEGAPMESGLSLVVQHKGNTYTWPIEFKWVTDSLDGKIDDDAGAEQFMLKHIKVTEGDKAKGPLVIKVAALKSGGALFVRSFKIFDLDQSFVRACKFGSPMLNMDTTQIRKMDLKKYRKKIYEVTDKDWALVESR